MHGKQVVSPAASVVDTLAAQGARLAIAESCTGGLLASLVTDVPGASDVLDRALVTYTPEAKVAELTVDEVLIREEGSVSAPVTEAMAERARELAATRWGLATSGFCGPTGGTAADPVGTVYVAVAGPDGIEARRHRFDGDRWTVKRAGAQAALDLLEHHVGGAG